MILALPAQNLWFRELDPTNLLIEHLFDTLQDATDRNKRLVSESTKFIGRAETTTNRLGGLVPRARQKLDDTPLPVVAGPANGARRTPMRMTGAVEGRFRGLLGRVDDRAAGWLRFLERKLTWPGDDWSKSGTPAPVWDNRSGAPTSNWYRFDAIGVATTLMLAARGGRVDRSTAAAHLDGIIDRLRQYHGFNEWVEQTGPDPDRAAYPNAWRGTLVPLSVWGSYDTPGWASNGLQGNGFEPNPVEAQGAIYFKGFFNYVLGLRALVEPTGGALPIDIVYDDRWSFRYSHNEINSVLVRDFESALSGRSDGLCCEIHKLWPL